MRPYSPECPWDLDPTVTYLTHGTSAFPVRAARARGSPPIAALLRISAQRYNETADHERLAEVLVGRGLS